MGNDKKKRRERLCLKCRSPKTLFMADSRRRHVERRIGGKEVAWAQHKTGVRDGHDGPILYSWVMLHVDVVPQGKNSVFNRAVRCRPGWQARASRMLVRIVARRVLLGGMIGCNPQMMARESGPLHDAG